MHAEDDIVENAEFIGPLIIDEDLAEEVRVLRRSL